MVLRLAQGGRLFAIVAGKTSTNHIDVVELCASPRHKIVCVMAIRAIVRRWHVNRLGVLLAQGWWPRTIVAGKATGKIWRKRVIKCGGLPCRHPVARTAFIACSEVGTRAARRTAAIMAASAVGDVTSEAVIKLCRRPCNSRMARLAQFAGQKVRLRFARSRYVVMALGAAINDARMVKHANVPGNTCVARRAIIARTNMIEGLALSLLIVVAFFAGLLCQRMIKSGNGPSRSLVTISASIR
jgi:hypothetical protein